MSHLTKAEPKNLFRTDVPGRTKDVPQESGIALQPVAPSAPFAVGVAMTPEQARQVTMANYPGYDWPSVRNLEPRKRGYQY